MSSPSISRRKPCPWMPPPLENVTSKSNCTRLSVLCSLSMSVLLSPSVTRRYLPPEFNIVDLRMDLDRHSDFAAKLAPIDDMNPTCRHEKPFRSYECEIERI